MGSSEGDSLVRVVVPLVTHVMNIKIIYLEVEIHLGPAVYLFLTIIQVDS